MGEGLSRSGRSTGVRAHPLTTLAAALLVAACGIVPTPSGSPGGTSIRPAATAATRGPQTTRPVPASATTSTPAAPSGTNPGASPTATGVAGSTPGRPYSAADVLRQMRESPRLEGVPARVLSEAVAQQIAERIWTWDGKPYQRWQLEGSCGPRRCELGVQGVPSFTPPEDEHIDGYQFDVSVQDLTVKPVRADGRQLLAGYPAALDAELDAIVRSGVDASLLQGQTVAGATWSPPPDSGIFELSYTDGNEEGGRSSLATVDLRTRKVLTFRAVPTT